MTYDLEDLYEFYTKDLSIKGLIYKHMKLRIIIFYLLIAFTGINSFCYMVLYFKHSFIHIFVPILLTYVYLQIIVIPKAKKIAFANYGVTQDKNIFKPILVSKIRIANLSIT